MLRAGYADKNAVRMFHADPVIVVAITFLMAWAG
jgi:hypothetical protein